MGKLGLPKKACIILAVLAVIYLTTLLLTNRRMRGMLPKTTGEELAVSP